MKTKIITLGLAAMLSTTACAGTQAGAPTSVRTDLAGQTYQATEIEENGTTRKPAAGTTIELSFGADGTLDATAGCNSISAEIETDGNRLALTGMAMTEKFCPAVGDQEQWLADFLTTGPAWHLDGDRLALDHDGTVLRLLDRRIADPDRPLTVTRWKLDIIETGPTGADDDAVTSAVPSVADAFLTIAPDGTLTGSTGCNTMSAQVQISGDHLIVGDVTTTRKGCPDEVATIERAVLATLQQTVGYRVNGAVLTLTGPAGTGLQMSATTR